MRAWIKGLALVGALAGGAALVGGCQDNKSGATREVTPGTQEMPARGGGSELPATGGSGQDLGQDEGKGGSGQQFDAQGVRPGEPGSGLQSLPHTGEQPSEGKAAPQGQSSGRDDANFNARGVEDGRVGTGFESLTGPGKEPSEGKARPQPNEPGTQDRGTNDGEEAR